MSVHNELPEVFPGTQVREVANVVQTLAQLAALRRDMNERRQTELLREQQRQLERAEMQQQQEEREIRRRAEQAERDELRRIEQAERDELRRIEQAERDVTRRAEMDERERLRDDKRQSEQQLRDQERRAEQQQRDEQRRLEQEQRNDQRTAEMLARDQERRRNRVDQLNDRADRAKRTVDDAIAELAEAERRLHWLTKQAETAHGDLDEALDKGRPDWEIRKLRDMASRADEEVQRGHAAVGKAGRRAVSANDEYQSAVDSLDDARLDYAAHQGAAAATPSQASGAEASPTPSPGAASPTEAENLEPAEADPQQTAADPAATPGAAELPAEPEEFRIADAEGAEAVAAAKRVAVPTEEQRPSGPAPTPVSPAPPLTPTQAETPKRTR